MRPRRAAALALAVSVGAALAALPAGSADDAPAVILVTADGLRWQEVFGGADAALLTPAEGVAKPDALKQVYWRETAAERRAVLLPFLWGTVAAKGQLHGNQWQKSVVKVTNGRHFSYPGYNELLTGAADPRIDSNRKAPNPNVTVLEWLEKRAGFGGRVAAFCSWNVFPFILNRERSGLVVNAGWEPADRPAAQAAALGAEIERELPAPWNESRFDVLTFHAALEHLRAKKPRVLYVSLGETDEWAHLGRYPEYLDAARRADAYLARLWETAQSIPELKDRTSLVVTTDHGRGNGPKWRHHAADVPGADGIWLAVLGPRTPALGEAKGGDALTQSQVAATVAALAGEDYAKDVKSAAPAVAAAVR